jgi:general secretion pathway protein G
MSALMRKKMKQFFIPKVVKESKGFSLIEILIALTLLGLAGTFVVGRIFQSLEEGQIKSTKIQMDGISQRLKEFRRKCGYYPSTEQGLDALVNKPTSGRECRDYPPGGFIDGGIVPKDAWNMDFVYESDGRDFNIFSYGPDTEEGTEDDISYRDNKDAAGQE